MDQTKGHSDNEPDEEILSQWTRKNGHSMDQKKGHLDNRPDEETGIQ